MRNAYFVTSHLVDACADRHNMWEMRGKWRDVLAVKNSRRTFDEEHLTSRVTRHRVQFRAKCFRAAKSDHWMYAVAETHYPTVIVFSMFLVFGSRGLDSS